MEFAIATKEFLELINPNIEAFVSEIDINGGEDVQKKIIEKITDSDILILCFTKENKKSPWLIFEAGFARGIKKNVIPILFDADPYWHSWIDNPMNVTREISFHSRDFRTALIKSFQISNTNSNLKLIEDYREAVQAIKENYRLVDLECEDLVETLIQNDIFVKENPVFRDKSAHFLAGFESFDLYKAILDSFQYTGKHLWIYGRKNMKLFGGSFNSFFKYIKDKARDKNIGMAGIDFRCLFLDPNSDEVKRAHIQQNIFEVELNATIMRAKDVIGDNLQLKKCFRYYSNRREEIIIRVDNSIIYSRPNFDANGCPQLLTNSGFEVFSAKSDKGKKCIEKYQKVWSEAKEMD